ncbi:alpha-L-fucosidase [Neolewinella agarilytica]|nr:alpha-L-fucosidase [Neolewinella agarilytica]
MPTFLRFTFLCALSVFISFCTSPASSTEAVQAASYTEDWTSLAKNEKEPDWFKDAKLGIYFHWGVYSVPAFQSEWYPRWMYVADRGDKWGGKIYGHHQATYGKDFNYHDFIPDFGAEQFDAAEWAELFKSAGAKFAGPVAQHHDGFAMWDSEINQWNAMDKGPGKDILGDIFSELKKRDLKTIATFHHARLLQRNAQDSTEWAGSSINPGSGSHYPYHPDLITSTNDPELKYLYGNIPADEFHDYWLGQVNEVVDKYSPDIIWFDSWLDQIPESYLRKMVAHHFNAGAANAQEVLVAYKQEDLPANVGVLDIEQGGKKDISDDYWLTDITISRNSWSYIEGQTYKSPSLLIRNMIDVWSKRGIVLLNVSPMAAGVIPEEQRVVLAGIGQWISQHAEAVYPTRPHDIFGYGLAEIKDGHFGGQAANIAYTENDLRFTLAKDGSALYVYALGLPPANTEMEVEHILGGTKDYQVKGVSVVGSEVALDWSVEGELLKFRTPAQEEMNEIATVFRVELQ